jgi:protease-4
VHRIAATHPMAFLAAVLLAAACAGCGPGGGLLITPVPAEQSLEEKVLAPDPGWTVGDRIAILDLDGLLVNEEQGPLFGPKENPVAFFMEKLQKAEDDGRVRAVVVRINSPGGAVTASDILYHELVAFRRRTGKPVVAAMMDTAASGGYYVAQAADLVVAHDTTVTGSIGVVFQTFSLEGLLGKIGVTTDAIKSGPNKDMASPLKALSPEAKKILQDLIDEYYNRFVDVVAASHPGIKREQIVQLADGRIYTGRQAHALGLVDRLGYLPDAIDAAARAAGIERYRIVTYHRPLGWKQNIYSASPVGGQFNLVNLDAKQLLAPAGPTFMYLWRPEAE